jgi:two-component system sensor histidine kinase CpxA
MLGWLALHLVVLAVCFALFVAFQLRLGLDSLLSGSTGERLGNFGEGIARELRASSREEWPEILRRYSEERGVTLDLRLSSEEWVTDAFDHVPENVTKRLTLLPGGPPPLRAGYRPPPPPREDDFGAGPPDEPRFFPPPDRGGAASAQTSRPQPLAKPVFLTRGNGGDGYWAAIDLFLPSQGPRSLLVLRADDLAGNGLLFDLRPWWLGGLAVLGLSIAFWTPFALSMSRYARRLTRQTERIAEGDFLQESRIVRNDELGRLGHAVNAMSARLEQLVTGQRRFLADIAHELCAPLARLRTGLGVMEQAMPESQRERLAAVEEEAGELAQLIEEVLAFSRAGAGRAQLQSVALEPLVRVAVSREAENLDVLVALRPGLVVLADPRLLSRAFANVIRNARIHAGSGGRLEIQGSYLSGKIFVQVRDYGPGVQEIDLPRLFEPFYRPDRSRARETGGSGLGLAIVRASVEACGGRVSATNLPDGFEVRFEFPAGEL